jgi:DNA integrity scanning protein DisA with diadenylate cyclase activity
VPRLLVAAPADSQAWIDHSALDAQAPSRRSSPMTPKKLTDQSRTLMNVAVGLAATMQVEAILLLVDAPTEWDELGKLANGQKVIAAADRVEQVAGADEAGIPVVLLEMPESPVHEKLGQALLEAVADDLLAAGASVVALYSGFDADMPDSLSIIHLDEHLGRLTSRDLRQLETRVPLDTLKTVVDLAVEIGREGREGKPVGTLMVVGDTRKVLTSSHPTGFDPMKGYSRKERNLRDPRVREGIKEIAQMDGAFVIAADGTVEAAARYIDAPATNITLSKGLGSRHWAAAAITRATNAVAIAVSESNGTVRIFNNGEVFLRIEPMRRAMKWKGFDFERPDEE